MRQTAALLVDAYRELNHRKLFWITLVLSGLIVVAFAAVGNDEEGLTFLHWSIPFPFVSTNFIPRADFYKYVFANLGVGFWLSWIATIIALISTASILPDFVDRGSIDLMLSKPIGRTRLFLTKFATGLLFAAMQVTVFTIASFLVIGVRGGDWEPWLFVAIPLVVIFYSYLFAVQAVVGMMTRSVIASIIAVMLFWLTLFLVQSGDGVTLAWRVTQEIIVERKESRIVKLEERAFEAEAIRVEMREAAELGDPDAEERLVDATNEADLSASRLIAVRQELVEDREVLEKARLVNGWLHAANTVLPKTSETIDILERLLREHAGLVIPGPGEEDDTRRQFGEMVGGREFEERMTAALDESHSFAWVLGTSLAFEALVLGIGVFWFARRDF